MTNYEHVHSFKTAMHNLNINMHRIRIAQTHQRVGEVHDEFLLESNRDYVMYHSIVQSIVIIISGLMQSYFIKKLFQSPSSKKGFYPRA